MSPTHATHVAATHAFYSAFDEDPEKLAPFFTPDAVDHDGPAGAESAKGSMHARARGLHTNFPGFRREIERVSPIDASHVFVRWRITVEHARAAYGIPPTHRRVSFHGHDVFGFRVDKIAEVWHVEELFQLLGQLRHA